jgi:hypothetical protein
MHLIVTQAAADATCGGLHGYVATIAGCATLGSADWPAPTGPRRLKAAPARYKGGPVDNGEIRPLRPGQELRQARKRPAGWGRPEGAFCKVV